MNFMRYLLNKGVGGSLLNQSKRRFRSQLSGWYESLLVKWLWRVLADRKITWAHVIRSKYGIQENGWDANMAARR